jgi:hypothetical protein
VNLECVRSSVEEGKAQGCNVSDVTTYVRGLPGVELGAVQVDGQDAVTGPSPLFLSLCLSLYLSLSWPLYLALSRPLVVVVVVVLVVARAACACKASPALRGSHTSWTNWLSRVTDGLP